MARFNKELRADFERRVGAIAEKMGQAYSINYNPIYGGWEMVEMETATRQGENLVGGLFGHRMSHAEFDAFLSGMGKAIDKLEKRAK